MWSHIELEKLQLLDQNTRDMLGQASRDFHLPALESEPLPPGRKSLAGSKILSPSLLNDVTEFKATKKRATAMLDAAGYGMDLNDTELGEEFALEETIARLKEIQLTSIDPRQMLAISGIVGELQAGVCQVRFHSDGSIERFVTLHALRVLRPADNQVLIQVGRWRPRHSFVPACVYPGSKRPSAKDFVAFIDFLMRELMPLLGGHTMEKTGSSSEVFKDHSKQFGDIPTTYRRMLQHVKLKPRLPGRKSLKLDPSVREISPVSAGLSMVFNVPVAPNAMVILRSSSEAEVYAWIPAALADLMEGSKASKDVKSALKQWAMRFEEEVNSYCTSATNPEEPGAGTLAAPARKRTTTGSFSH